MLQPRTLFKETFRLECCVSVLPKTTLKSLKHTVKYGSVWHQGMFFQHCSVTHEGQHALMGP